MRPIKPIWVCTARPLMETRRVFCTFVRFPVIQWIKDFTTNSFVNLSNVVDHHWNGKYTILPPVSKFCLSLLKLQCSITENCYSCYRIRVSPKNHGPVSASVNQGPASVSVNQRPVSVSVNQGPVSVSVNQGPVSVSVNQVPVSVSVNHQLDNPQKSSGSWERWIKIEVLL